MGIKLGILVGALLLIGGTAAAGERAQEDKSDLEAPSAGETTPFGQLDAIPLEDLGVLEVAVRDYETGAAIDDAEVELLGTERLASMSDAEGNARFEDADFAHATLRVRKEGFIPALIHHPPREKADAPRVIVELHQRVAEGAEFRSIFGEPLSETKGTLLVRFEPRKNGELPAGITVELDAPGAVAWVFDAADEVVKGSTLGEHAKERTVTFPNVAIGSHPLTANPGRGWECTRARGVVEAGVFTTVHLSCGKEGAE